MTAACGLVAVPRAERGRLGCTLPAGTGLADTIRAARRLQDDGFGTVWLHDLAWDDGPCGFTEAVLAGAQASRVNVGLWVAAGRDHPVRFAEEVAVVGRLLGGRLLVGVRGECPPAWAHAVAHAWDDAGLEVERPVRLPGRDPANEWVPPGWRLRVAPAPASPLVWHVLDAEPPAGVPARRVSARALTDPELGDLELVGDAACG